MYSGVYGLSNGMSVIGASIAHPEHPAKLGIGCVPGSG
jgi:hypothetical protein